MARASSSRALDLATSTGRSAEAERIVSPGGDAAAGWLARLGKSAAAEAVDVSVSGASVVAATDGTESEGDPATAAVLSAGVVGAPLGASIATGP